MNDALAIILVAFICAVGCKAETVDPGRFLEEWREQRDQPVEIRTRAKLLSQTELEMLVIGKSRKSTYEALGLPDVENSRSEIIYKLGTDPSFGIDFWELHIFFDEVDVVTSIAVYAY